MRRFVFVLWLVAFGPVAWAQTTAPAGPASASSGAVKARATSVASPTSTSGPTGVAKLREDGLECAKTGEFETSLSRFRAAARLEPNDESLARSVRLLEDYLAKCRQWRDSQTADFDLAVQRVRWAMMAQAYLPKLTEANLEGKLREKFRAVGSVRERGMSLENLELASPEKAAEVKANAAKTLQKVSDALKGVSELLQGDTSEYGKNMQELTTRAREQVDRYAKAWAAIDVQTAKSDRLSARSLRPLEEEMMDAVENVETLSGVVGDAPWRIGLYQARVAKLLAPDRTKMAQYDWYRKLVEDVKARGEDAMKSARWYDALGVYASLQDLDPDDELFKEQSKIARRHARVLGLYGRRGADANAAKSDANAATQPAKDDSKTQPEDEEPWRDLVEGVDADIAIQAISQLDEHYVTSVDYRKLAHGALLALRVLAETPQTSASFPGLADDAKRKEFLAAIEREGDNIDHSNSVGYTRLQALLNTMIRESEKTVDIPVAVIVVEFMDGLLEELDKFSAMIWPHDVDDFNKQTMGQFYGVGIQIAKETGEPLKVVTPLPDSPAYREGIKSGDLILAVDGKPTNPLTIDKLVRMITGPKGTKVVLTIESPGQAQPKDVTLIRDEIQIRTIKGWRHLGGGDGDNWDFLVDANNKIGYIRMTQFTETTTPDLDRALTELKAQGVRSVVLDLRGNPGGLLDQARKVADDFLSGATGTIVSTGGRQKPPTVFRMSVGGLYTNGDLVVLVNEMSASAAEIVSGALKDWRRALIVGQRTYGKGSVQNVIPIQKHNARLKLTTAYYYLPSGRCLHRQNGSKDWGVDPDVDVMMTPRQARHWGEVRRKTELLQDFDPDELSEDLRLQYADDVQLNAAVLLLKLLQLQPHRMGFM